MKKELQILKNDPWLEPFAQVIEGRHGDVERKEQELCNGGGTLSDFANAHNFFGLHRDGQNWVFREWAPNATDIYLVGTFNDWKETEDFRMKRIDNGAWEIHLDHDQMRHGDLYKLHVHWDGGDGERIPAYATRVVQDPESLIFSAQVWAPEKSYKFKMKNFKPNVKPLMIYECHIGMATTEERVGTYDEFRTNVLPRIQADGYNAIQIMAIQEHPYYGSFGYHVSSFFAASSRFGTPDDLKHLIDDAHCRGIAVIMDIVHSHAVKNEVEGLGRFDGSYDLYFYGDGRREHPAWDSLCFDYGKNAVIHFLLSNCKFWLEEYKFDGFRFDGVTSMLYYSHGLGTGFRQLRRLLQRQPGHQRDNLPDALPTNSSIEVNPQRHHHSRGNERNARTCTQKLDDGGIGFDYRMAMGIPDYWIKTIEREKGRGLAPDSQYSGNSPTAAPTKRP
jgi:1,4-alpha-glucan branching enzyme